MNREIMNEEETRHLLRPLAGDPPGPSRVDVPRAMAEGRRRRRTRFWATGTAVAALTATPLAGGTLAVGALSSPGPVPIPDVIASVSPAPMPRMTLSAMPSVSVPPVTGPAGCTVTRLPTDGVDKAIVSGGDPSGRWFVGRLYPADSAHPQVLWKDGRIAAKFRMSGADGRLNDVNRAGQAVGADFSGGDQRAWTYTDGALRRLRGGAGHAQAINDAGVIVGRLGTGIRSAAARWDSATAAPVELDVPAGTSDSSALDIDEDGTILGQVTRSADTAGVQTGYLWLPDGTARVMPLPDVDGVRAGAFWAESIRNGWVAGRSVVDAPDGSRSFAWFRYRIATATYERLPEEAGMPDRIAANGWVLGTAAEPRIYRDGRVTRLPRYQKGTEYQMAGYSDDGLIAGGHMTGVGSIENQPLMWQCRFTP